VAVVSAIEQAKLAILVKISLCQWTIFQTCCHFMLPLSNPTSSVYSIYIAIYSIIIFSPMKSTIGIKH
jgi:hypothetical protein